jgi:ANTAR domain/GAF domain
MKETGESRPSLHVPTPKEAAAAIVRAAVELVPDARSAGLNAVKGSLVTNLSATDDIAVQLDVLQSELGEGPSLLDGRVLLVPDVASVDNWPRWAKRAHDLGVTSVLTHRLGSGHEIIGALNLYSSRVSAFDDIDVVALSLLADRAAFLLDVTKSHVDDLERIAQLEEAIKSRDMIGQAKGILMEREGCSADEAFDMLRTASQHLNRKLRAVAADLVAQTQRDPRAGRDSK